MILSLSKNTFGERPSAISLKFTVPKVSKILIFYDDSLISSSASVSVLLSFLAGALLFYLKAKNYKDGFLPDPPSGFKSTSSPPKTVVLPIAIARTPVAIGSNVPIYPAFFRPRFCFTILKASLTLSLICFAISVD